VRLRLLAPPGGGFPRTIAQATAAADLGKRLRHTPDAVVYLDVPEPVLTRRLLARGAQDGRTDDTADVTRHRLAVFAEMTRPHIRYYENRGIFAISCWLPGAGSDTNVIRPCRDRGMVHVEDIRPDFLDDVLPHIAACDHERLAEG